MRAKSIDAVKHGNQRVKTDPESTIDVILDKLDQWATQAPIPSSLEEVRMLRETLSALTAVVKERRTAEEDELDDMSEEELRAKARELGLTS